MKSDRIYINKRSSSSVYFTYNLFFKPSINFIFLSGLSRIACISIKGAIIQYISSIICSLSLALLLFPKVKEVGSHLYK